MRETKRDYKGEYQRRLESGAKKGLSRSQSRGHPKISEPHIKPARRRIPDRHRIEIALSELADGKSLTASARSARITPERFRDFISREGIAEKSGRHWKIRDEHPREMGAYSKGKAYTLTVNNVRGDASLLGRYLAAVRYALDHNDETILKPFKGKSVADIHGTKYPLETRLAVLYERNRADPFENAYRYVF